MELDIINNALTCFKNCSFLQTGLQFAQKCVCQSYRPLLSTAIKGTFYWKEKKLPLHAPSQVPAGRCLVLHTSQLNLKSSSNTQRLETSLGNPGGPCVGTVLRACTLTCDRCTNWVAGVSSNHHRA